MNPKIQCHKSKTGAGLFAVRNVRKDELLVGWAGKVVHLRDILRVGFFLTVSCSSLRCYRWMSQKELTSSKSTKSCSKFLSGKDTTNQLTLSIIAVNQMQARSLAASPGCTTHHVSTGFGNSPISLVAMRDIKRGEEVFFDYAMCESIDGLKGNEFSCTCGVDTCRGQFTGADWKNPALWDKYGDYFSPYLRAKIKKLKKEMYRKGVHRQSPTFQPMSL